MKNGTCYLCGCNRRLSKEHIPPRCAYNQKHYKEVLCEYCNNWTGVYAEEYGFVVKQILPFLSNIKSQTVKDTNLEIPLRKIKPLRLVKYLYLLSIITSGNVKFREKHIGLCNFITWREDHWPNVKYKIHINLFDQPYIFTSGIQARTDIQNNKTSVFSEFRCPPFCVIISMDQNFENMKDISFMTTFSFGETIDELWIPMQYVVPSGPYVPDKNGNKVQLL